MLDKNIINEVKRLNEIREEENNSLYLSKLIKEKSNELGLSYVELYNLLMNKEYLIEEVEKENNIIDIKLDTIKNELDELKLLKRYISSVICDLYGHEFTDYKGTNIQTCKRCGKQQLIQNKKSLLKIFRRS